MMEIPKELYQGIYTEIVKSELSKKPKNYSIKVSCCKCGRTDKTLYKLNDEERICIDCKKLKEPLGEKN